jgi:hypothetical protein
MLRMPPTRQQTQGATSDRQHTPLFRKKGGVFGSRLLRA